MKQPSAPSSSSAETTNKIKDFRAVKTVALRDQQHEHAREITEKLAISEVLARVLAARGFTPGDALDTYLSPTLKTGLIRPSEMRNLEAACELIAAHVEKGNSLALCCDFDVDGLSGGALLANFLQDCNVTHNVYVPDRFSEGYGLNSRMIEQAAETGHSLLITIDYGTTNKSELAHAASLGMQTIVIDHHHVGDHDPGADVFVNPQHADCGFADGTLCAAGLVWYLVVALKKHLEAAKDLDPRSYLDLACLGTICDMVPLKGVNRVIASKGLQRLTHTPRPGLIALKQVIGIPGEVTGGHIGFGIGPRINAAGRMLSGEAVISLLTTPHFPDAQRIAKRLNRLNQERQDTEQRIKQKAFQMVEDSPTLPWGIMVYDEEFHTGVIGIVAQRLVETFYRPAIVSGKDGDFFKGSVRGVKGFSVVDTLNSLGEYLHKFGGHEGAGGFSVAPDKVEAFAAAFNEECKRRLATLPLQPAAVADTSCSLADITPALIGELKSLAPFGIGNSSPLLLIEDLLVSEVRVLKNAHLKVVLSDGHVALEGLMWRTTDHPALQQGNQVDVVVKAEINSFRGRNTVQLQVQAARESVSAGSAATEAA